MSNFFLNMFFELKVVVIFGRVLESFGYVLFGVVEVVLKIETDSQIVAGLIIVGGEFSCLLVIVDGLLIIRAKIIGIP